MYRASLCVLLSVLLFSSPATNLRNRGRSYSYSSRDRSRRPGHTSSSFSDFNSYSSESAFDDSDGASFVETFSDDYSGNRKRHARTRNRNNNNNNNNNNNGYSSYYNSPYGYNNYGVSVPVDPAYLRDERGVDNQGNQR